MMMMMMMQILLSGLKCQIEEATNVKSLIDWFLFYDSSALLNYMILWCSAKSGCTAPISYGQ